MPVGRKPKLGTEKSPISRVAYVPRWLSADAQAEWRRVMPLLVERRDEVSGIATAIAQRCNELTSGLIGTDAVASAERALGLGCVGLPQPLLMLAAPQEPAECRDILAARPPRPASRAQPGC